MKKVALTRKRNYRPKRKLTINVTPKRIHRNENSAKLIEIESYNYFGEWFGALKRRVGKKRAA